MKIQKLFCSWLLVFLFVSSAAAFSPGERVVITFPQIPLQKGERIVEFDLTVRSGQVIGMNKIPKDWSIDLAGEQSSETKNNRWLQTWSRISPQIDGAANHCGHCRKTT